MVCGTWHPTPDLRSPLRDERRPLRRIAFRSFHNYRIFGIVRRSVSRSLSCKPTWPTR